MLDQFPGVGDFQFGAYDDGQMLQGLGPRQERATVPDIGTLGDDDKAQ